MTLQCGSDGEKVGRVAVYVCQKVSVRNYSTVHWDLNQSPGLEFTPPNIEVNTQVKLALLNAHTDFPGGYGGDCGIIVSPRLFNLKTHLRPQPGITGPQPYDDVSVQENQNKVSFAL